MAYKLQYLGLGGVLDQAVAIVKDKFGLLLGIMFLVMVPFELAIGLLNISMMPTLYDNPTPEQSAAMLEAQLAYLPYVLIGTMLYGFVVMPVTNAAVIQGVARVYLGQPVTAVEALKHGLRRLIPLLWTNLLMMLAIFGGCLLLIIPGILFALWFGLAQQVVVIEGVSGPAALGRSKKLVRKHLGTFLLLGLIMFIISTVLNQIGVWIPQPHLSLVVVTLVQAAVTMLWSAALVVFYFSCRCDVDQFDLHYLAQSMGADVVPVEQDELSTDADYPNV